MIKIPTSMTENVLFIYNSMELAGVGNSCWLFGPFLPSTPRPTKQPNSAGVRQPTPSSLDVETHPSDFSCVYWAVQPAK